MFRTTQCRSHRLAYLLQNQPQANVIGPYIPSEMRRGLQLSQTFASVAVSPDIIVFYSYIYY